MANGTSETKGLGPRDAYSMKKRGVFKQAKVGQTYTYDGRNATMPDGSRVKVVGATTRPMRPTRAAGSW